MNFKGDKYIEVSCQDLKHGESIFRNVCRNISHISSNGVIRTEFFNMSHGFEFYSTNYVCVKNDTFYFTMTDRYFDKNNLVSMDRFLRKLKIKKILNNENGMC